MEKPIRQSQLLIKNKTATAGTVHVEACVCGLHSETVTDRREEVCKSKPVLFSGTKLVIQLAESVQYWLNWSIFAFCLSNLSPFNLEWVCVLAFGSVDVWRQCLGWGVAHCENCANRSFTSYSSPKLRSQTLRQNRWEERLLRVGERSNNGFRDNINISTLCQVHKVHLLWLRR